MLVGTAQAWSPEEWWTELGKGPSRKQSSALPPALREDLAGGKEVLVSVEGFLIHVRGMRGGVGGGGNVDGEG